ncbi:MAG: hypothetical protein ACO4AJ_03390, partial [Prochlorothrix sp.]
PPPPNPNPDSAVGTAVKICINRDAPSFQFNPWTASQGRKRFCLGLHFSFSPLAIGPLSITMPAR